MKKDKDKSTSIALADLQNLTLIATAKSAYKRRETMDVLPSYNTP